MFYLSPVGCHIFGWQLAKSRTNMVTSEQNRTFATWNLLNLINFKSLFKYLDCYRYIVLCLTSIEEKIEWMDVERVWDDVLSSFIMFWSCRLPVVRHGQRNMNEMNGNIYKRWTRRLLLHCNTVKITFPFKIWLTQKSVSYSSYS